MRLFALIAFICASSAFAFAQTEAQKISPEEYNAYLHEDITNGRHVAWTKAQLKSEKKECIKATKEMMKNASDVCNCMIEELASVMNYSRFAEMSEYQRGKATATIGAQNCRK